MLRFEPIDYKGYTIRLARQTGGKAGKGYNKTSTVQIVEKFGFDGLLERVVKMVRYEVGKPGELEKAIDKAKQKIDQMTEQAHEKESA